MVHDGRNLGLIFLLPRRYSGQFGDAARDGRSQTVQQVHGESFHCGHEYASDAQASDTCGVVPFHYSYDLLRRSRSQSIENRSPHVTTTMYHHISIPHHERK